MKSQTARNPVHLVFGLVLGVLVVALVPAAQAQSGASDASVLRAKYSELQGQLYTSAFQRPLVLNSRQANGSLQADVHAVVQHPHAAVGAAAGAAASWCEIMILHLNVKQCAASQDAQGDVITVAIGRKNTASADGAHRVAFRYRLVARTDDFVRVELTAETGPMGTSDYRIIAQALAIDGNRTFLNLSYSYSYGPAAAMAMRTYFSTSGADKVGFTVLERSADGQPVYVGGIRGALERNTMRYFLALVAHLDGADAPVENRFERRLQLWFAATERHPIQLRELQQAEYLAQKRVDTNRLASAR